MNNKYGENPKKKISIIKDNENNKQKEEGKDNKEAETNQDNKDNEISLSNKYIEDENSLANKKIEDNENSLSNKYIEDNQSSQSDKFHKNKEGNEDSKDSEDYEYYDDYEDDESNQNNEDDEDNGNYEDDLLQQFVSSAPRYQCDKNGNARVFLLGDSFRELRKHYEFTNFASKYKKLPTNFNNTNQIQLVKKLNAQIDFDEILIDNIQELKIDQFYFNNLIHINLSLYLDIKHEQQAIKFIQSILNIQSLKDCIIYIIPKKGEHYGEFIDKILKQLEFKSNINKQDIQVHDWRQKKYYYGLKILSDEGKINKIIFKSFFQIKLEDIQQLQNVQILEINSYQPCSYLNEFLKKLINLSQLNITDWSTTEQEMKFDSFKKQLSVLKNLKILNISVDIYIKFGVYKINISQNINYNFFRQQLIKQFKKLLKLNFNISE